MEITYSLTEEDVIALNLFRVQNDPSLKKRIKRARLRLAISFAIVGIGIWLLVDVLFFLICFLTLSILSYLLYNQYYEWRVTRRVNETYKDSRYKNTLNPHTLVATSDGLVEVSPLGQMKVEWKTVDGFFETSTHVFISIGQVISVPIPKHTSTFSSDELNEFISTCQLLKQQAA